MKIDTSLLCFFKEGGFDARFVGGCVRDFLLHYPIHDFDVAIHGDLSQVIEYCKKKNVATIPIGVGHGTIGVLFKSILYEVTILRRDISCDGRYACVERASTFEEDSNRRDFTMNAIYLDKNNHLYDYHHGIEDLLYKRVRFIGNPHTRIQEDFLRIWRYYRFLTRYGTPTDALFLDLNYHRCGLLSLSRERITHEILSLFSSFLPLAAVKERIHVLKQMVCVLRDSCLFEIQFEIQCPIDWDLFFDLLSSCEVLCIAPSLPLMLWVLKCMMPSLERKIVFTRSMKRQINAVEFLKNTRSLSCALKFILNEQDVFDFLILCLIEGRGDLREELFVLFKKKNEYPFPVRGGDFVGLVPKSDIKKVLTLAEEIWYEHLHHICFADLPQNKLNSNGERRIFDFAMVQHECIRLALLKLASTSKQG